MALVCVLTAQGAMKRAFVECNSKLAKSKIDCTFSGTTAVVVYLDDDMLYCGNTGDSRAVLAQKTDKAGVFKAIDLSDDQKPDRPDEVITNELHTHNRRVLHRCLLSIPRTCRPSASLRPRAAWPPAREWEERTLARLACG